MTRFHEQMKQAREEDEVEEMDINTRMGLMMIAKSIVDERAQLRQNKEEDHCECGDKVVDYGDKLCHKCYHKSCEDEGEKCYCEEEEEEEMDYWVANGGTIEFITCILQEVMDGGHEEWGSLCDFVDRRK
jgi:hypothetical protein